MLTELEGSNVLLRVRLRFAKRLLAGFNSRGLRIGKRPVGLFVDLRSRSFLTVELGALSDPLEAYVSLFNFGSCLLIVSNKLDI